MKMFKSSCSATFKMQGSKFTTFLVSHAKSKTAPKTKVPVFLLPSNYENFGHACLKVNGVLLTSTQAIQMEELNETDKKWAYLTRHTNIQTKDSSTSQLLPKNTNVIPIGQALAQGVPPEQPVSAAGPWLVSRPSRDGTALPILKASYVPSQRRDNPRRSA